MVKEVMHEREDCLLTKRNITLKINPKVAKIFYEYQSVSGMMLSIILCLVEKGKFHRLLRKALIKDEKEVKAFKQHKLETEAEKVTALKLEIEKLKAEIDAKNEEIEKEKYNNDILSELHEKGVIDEEGRIIDKNDPNGMR